MIPDAEDEGEVVEREEDPEQQERNVPTRPIEPAAWADVGHDPPPNPIHLSLTSLPTEALVSVLQHASPHTLVRVARISRLLGSIAQLHLFRHPVFKSMDQFEIFLSVLEADAQVRRKPTGDPSIEDDLLRLDSDGLATRVYTVSLRPVRRLGADPIRGSSKISRLRLCRNLRELHIHSISDFRLKHLDGHGSLRLLHLSATTFRALSRSWSPHLRRTMQNVTSLTLSNCGLPSDEHFVSLIKSCADSLVSLSISSIRDVEEKAFLAAFANLFVNGPSVLQDLRLRNLTKAQEAALPLILSRLPVVSLEFSTPMPTLAHLRALPGSLETLTLVRRPDESPDVEETVVENLVKAIREGQSASWVRLRVWEGAVAILKSERFEGTVIEF